MRPRSDLIQLFSTFLIFEGNRGSWAMDSTLRRSMSRLLQGAQVSQTQQQAAEAIDPAQPWTLYWHDRWRQQQQRLAANHLLAYLQEPGYWCAQKISQRLQQQQYSLSDLFQTAMVRAVKVLNSFDPAVSKSLKSYAEFAFGNIIKDLLRQRREVDACTPWGLLNRVSRKRLAEALQQGGIQGPLQQSYLLAWRCYQAHYAPNASPSGAAGSRTSLGKLPPPGGEVWAAIAASYNRDRQTLTPPGPAATAQELEGRLLEAVKLLRHFQTPRSVSLDAPLKGSGGGGDGGDRESSDLYHLLPSSDTEDSLLSSLIEQEDDQARRQQQQQLSQTLEQVIAQLSSEDQALLRAYYGDQLTQGDIARQLNLKQYSISRQLSRLRRQLLTALLDWSGDRQPDRSATVAPVTSPPVTSPPRSNPRSKSLRSKNFSASAAATLHTPASPAVVDAMGESLEAWLASYYGAV